jgi:hypothetical protein
MNFLFIIAALDSLLQRWTKLSWRILVYGTQVRESLKATQQVELK